MKPVERDLLESYKRAAIICSHVAMGKLPILRAIRDEPVEATDSGWQFLCDTEQNENESEAQIWALFEVCEHTPSLKPYLDLHPRAVIYREDEHSSWKVFEE
jgi:hypothetical protein